MPVRPLIWRDGIPHGDEFPKLYEAIIEDFPFEYNIYEIDTNDVEYEVLLDRSIVEEGECRSLEEAKAKCEEYHNSMLKHAVE